MSAIHCFSSWLLNETHCVYILYACALYAYTVDRWVLHLPELSTFHSSYSLHVRHSFWVSTATCALHVAHRSVRNAADTLSLRQLAETVTRITDSHPVAFQFSLMLMAYLFLLCRSFVSFITMCAVLRTLYSFHATIPFFMASANFSPDSTHSTVSSSVRMLSELPRVPPAVAILLLARFYTSGPKRFYNQSSQQSSLCQCSEASSMQTWQLPVHLT